VSKVQRIESEADYGRALKEIERYFVYEPALGSREGDHFNMLAALIESYEEKYWPIAGVQT